MTCSACSCENVAHSSTCRACGASLGPAVEAERDAVVAHATTLAQRLHDQALRRGANAVTRLQSRTERTLDIGPLRLVVGGHRGSSFEPATRGGAHALPGRISAQRELVPTLDVREAVAAAVWERLASGARVVRIDCASGGGATTLLHGLAADARNRGFTRGAFVMSDTCGPAADVAQRLTAQLDPRPERRYYTAADRSSFLDGGRALILFDRAMLSTTDIGQLRVLFPDLSFIVVSPLALPAVPSISAGALDSDAVITLLESSYGRPIDVDNRRLAVELCATLGSLPGPTRLIGVTARRLLRSFISLRVQFVSGETIVRQLVSSLPEREQRILGILALARAPLATHHIAFAVRSGEIQAHLENLVACELVHACAPDAYQVPHYVTPFVPPVADAQAAFARVIDVVCDVLDSSSSVPVLDRQLAATEQLLREAAGDAQHHHVLELGPRLADAFAARGEFGAWGRVLELVETAALEARDAAALSRARHELGVRAMLLAEPDAATTYLTSANQERRAAGDEAGSAASTAVLALADRESHAPSVTHDPKRSPDSPPPPLSADAPAVASRAQPKSLGMRAVVLLGLSIAIIAILAFSLRQRPNPAPVITQLSSNPISVAGRRATQLCIDVRDAAVVEIFPDAARLAGSGRQCLTVRPATTTTYVAVGTAADGRQVRRAITVAGDNAGARTGLRIDAFSIRPTRIKAGQTIRLCYAVTGARLLRIVPQVGTLTRLRSCRILTLRDAHRYRYTLSATGENGQVTLRHVHVDVVLSPKPRTIRNLLDGRLVRQAIYQFDATPNSVERGQATSLCVGVERSARGFVTHIGPLKPGITRCYRVQPRVTTVYRLYVAVQTTTAIRTVSVAVRPPLRRREVARNEHR